MTPIVKASWVCTTALRIRRSLQPAKASNSVADGWSPVASHYKEITLAPGESKQLIFILGYVENPKDQKWNADGSMNKSRAYEMIEQYNTPEKVAAHWLN